MPFDSRSSEFNALKHDAAEEIREATNVGRWSIAGHWFNCRCLYCTLRYRMTASGFRSTPTEYLPPCSCTPLTPERLQRCPHVHALVERLHSTHAHSAWAVAAEVSRASAAITEACRSRTIACSPRRSPIWSLHRSTPTRHRDVRPSADRELGSTALSGWSQGPRGIGCRESTQREPSWRIPLRLGDFRLGTTHYGSSTPASGGARLLQTRCCRLALLGARDAEMRYSRAAFHRAPWLTRTGVGPCGIWR
jgi:hypothetical protein